MALEDLIKKIVSTSSLTEDEVKKKIEEKQHELSDLVSAEGAAYILAKEMGLDLVKRIKRQKNKISDLKPGEGNILLEARVVKVSPVREFQKEAKTFRVANVEIRDDTGSSRLTLWNEQTENLDRLKEGMPIEIFGGYAKEDMLGLTIVVGRRGGIKLLQDSILPELDKMTSTSKEKNLETLSVGEEGRVRATLVQLFTTENFFNVCPQCGRSAKPDGDKFKCQNHGEVIPNVSMVISGIVDDGFDNMRAVFFRNMAARLLGMDMEGAAKRKGILFDNVDIVGKEFIFNGRIRRNGMFNRNEFIVTGLTDVDLNQEINSMINNFEM